MLYQFNYQLQLLGSAQLEEHHMQQENYSTVVKNALLVDKV